MACKACGMDGHNRATCGRVKYQPTKPKRSLEEINRMKDQRLEVAYPGLLKQVGLKSDAELSKEYGITRAYVHMIRKRRGAESNHAVRREKHVDKLDELQAAGVIGSKPDRQISREHKIPLILVAARREKLGLPRSAGAAERLLDSIRDRVGVDSDCALSEEIGISVTTIYSYRKRNNIPCSARNANKTPRMTHTRSTYPWDAWADGEEHLIQKGVDFTCGIWSLACRIRGEAAGRGRRVSITPDLKAKTIKFRFGPREDV